MSDLLAELAIAARWRDPARRREARLKHGLTQHQVARHVGVSQPTIQRWETGQRNPRGAEARRYYEFLGVLERMKRDHI